MSGFYARLGCNCLTLSKAKKRRRRKIGSPEYLKWLGSATDTLAPPISKFLKEEAADIARELGEALGLSKALSLSPSEVEQLIKGIDFSRWARLIGVFDDQLKEAFAENARRGFEMIGIEASDDMLSLVNTRAVEYAEHRSAELVGMKKNKDGDWVENPRAQYAITSTTRDDLRSLVGDALEEGWSTDTFAREIEDSFSFSPERATTIARTELAFAHVEGNMAAWIESDVVEGKQWILGSEHDMDDECNDNADAGVIGLYDAFPSGHEGPPAHPNCVCDVVPVLKD